MKKSLSLLVLVMLVGCGSGRPPGDGIFGENDPPPPPPPPPPSASELFTQAIDGLALDDFYDVSYKFLLGRSPEDVVGLTLQDEIPQDFPTLDNFSDNFQRETFELYQLALDALQTYDRSTLTPEEQLNYDVYEWYLQDTLDELPFIYHRFAATYFGFSVQRATERFFTSLHPFQTLSDAQDYIDRLSVIDTKFQQLEQHLLNMQAAGIVEPALSMDVAINQINNILAGQGTNNVYYIRLSEGVDDIQGLNNATRTNLRNRVLGVVNTDVIPAYNSLLAALQNLRASAPTDVGYGQYPMGAEYYEYVLRHHTTSDLTAAEIHQLGLDELARIHAEMRTIFDQLGYPQNETLQELYARVEADGGIVAAADTFQTFSDLVAFAEANLPQAFDVFPMADVVVEPDPFGGFYIGPSFDGSRPGAFYAGTDFDQPYAPMPSLTFHESVPGHHLQIALAMESDLPLFRKLVRSTGFVEGWALYAERLAYELGWYDNDVYGNLGRLQFEALRAARLVIDTGIHSLGWTFDQAAQFNVDNVGDSLSSSQAAAARYSVWPGQATAYMVGMLQILSERQRAMDALGANFDLIAFHRALLTNGGVPLSLLPDVVDQYIASAQ
ncbi:MAG: DUF885 domain-containing protein [Woeseiaceae bacterium]|nr:DUF885 domain-containing protein [Woeseiaceae bacterium]